MNLSLSFASAGTGLAAILLGCAVLCTSCQHSTKSSSSADSTKIRKPKHQIVLQPQKKDPLAGNGIRLDTASGLTRLGTKEVKAGWKLLFNGKDLEGWKGFNTDTVGSAWKVSRGILRLDLSDRELWKSNHGGDLATVKTYGDFVLRLQYRSYANANSGILSRVQEGSNWKNAYDSGPEMQILDDGSNPDKTVANHRSASMFDLVAAPAGMLAFGPGRWNSVEITVRGRHFIYMLNGFKSVDIQVGSPAWKAAFAKSKFSKNSAFASFLTGSIDLQEHGGSVDFRNMMIKTL